MVEKGPESINAFTDYLQKEPDDLSRPELEEYLARWESFRNLL